MFKKIFKEEFDFHGFVSFVRDIFNNYGMGEIRFFPKNHKDIFTNQQLSHISPSWKVDDPYGFVFSWRKNKDLVRVVVFDQFSKFESKSRRIRMTIDLDKKFISLDEVRGLSSEEVDNALENNFGPNLVSESQNNQAEKSVGIWNRGKNNKLIDNNFFGLDVGIQDEGENSLALGNKFSDGLLHIEKVEIIGRDKIEQRGDGNRASIGDKKSKKEGFWSKIFWKLIVPILITVIAAVVIWQFGIK